MISTETNGFGRKRPKRVAKNKYIFMQMQILDVTGQGPVSQSVWDPWLHPRHWTNVDQPNINYIFVSHSVDSQPAIRCCVLVDGLMLWVSYSGLEFAPRDLIRQSGLVIEHKRSAASEQRS